MIGQHFRPGMGQDFDILVIDTDGADVALLQHIVGDILQDAGVTGHDTVFTGRRQLFGHGKGAFFQQAVEIP